MGIQTSLDAVLEAESIVDAMRLADDLAFEAGRDPGVRTLRVLGIAIAGENQLAVIASIHALAAIRDAEAGRMLTRLLSDARPFAVEHAAWALGSGLPRADAVGRLLGLVVEGGFAAMLAQRTLEQWSSALSDALVVGAEAALLGITEPEARARLVETLGLVRAPGAVDALVRAARDADEPEAVRIAAVSALGQRPGDLEVRDTIDELAAGDGFLAEVARLARIDLTATPRLRAASTEGVTIAQLFLHADIDPELRSAGAGDNGGIATLLVRLGDALAADPDTGVARVITLSRGSIDEAASDLRALRSASAGHVYGHIPLLREPTSAAAAWPVRVVARRGIRRVLRAVGHVDLLHLRMADVGSLAAADVARELGIPVVFTVAPDPHAVIESLGRSGQLTAHSFGDADADEHFWFRARLVQSLAANAAHTVLFPRPQLQDDMRRLVGIDLTAHPERHTIVPEGVDIDTIDTAVAEAAAHAAGAEPTPAIAELRELVSALAPERHGLPLLVSVGRLHRVKGMAALVEAWATSSLAERANLLIIGGDTATPSRDELEQLTRIESVVPSAEWARRGLLLPGHRPNDVAARWLGAVRVGLPGLSAPRGVYVCASLKEEFGIALLEAMASGLYVVAPETGGPATYVDDGDTGRLAPTWNLGELTRAVGLALDAMAVESGEDRPQRSRATVSERFTIQRMSSVLGEVYRGVARDEAELLALVGSSR